MTRFLGLLLLSVIALSGCQSVPDRWRDQPTGPEFKHIRINGANLSYVVQGRGIPLLFIHGELSDYRFWEGQRLAFSDHYRFVALNLRYHGTARWPDNANYYSEAIHAADVSSFIRAAGFGPVYLVGSSYGANIALDVALEHPDLVFGIVMEEPAAPALISGPPARKALNEFRKEIENTRAMLRGGDPAGAARLFAEWLRNMGRGSFADQSETFRSVTLSNARTLRPFLDRKRLPPLTCERLGKLKPAALIINGAKTRRFYALSGEAISHCISSNRHVVIPDATHSVAEQDPTAFNEAVRKFLSTN